MKKFTTVQALEFINKRKALRRQVPKLFRTLEGRIVLAKEQAAILKLLEEKGKKPALADENRRKRELCRAKALAKAQKTKAQQASQGRA